MLPKSTESGKEDEKQFEEKKNPPSGPDGQPVPPVSRNVDLDELLLFNDLTYEIDPVLTTCVSRQFEGFFSNESSYVSRPVTTSLLTTWVDPLPSPSKIEIEVFLSTGSRFVSPCSSYVAFDIEVTFPTVSANLNDYAWRTDLSQVLLFPTSSKAQNSARQTALWTRLFRRIDWIHANKQVIDSIAAVPDHSTLEFLTRSSDWKESFGTLCQLEGAIFQFPLTPPAGTQLYQVVIPMDLLLPSWKYELTEKGMPTKLMPNRLVAGSMLRFELADIWEVWTQTAIDGFGNYVFPTPPVIADTGLDMRPFSQRIRNFRVVCDMREMVTTVDNLLWNQSAAYGVPIAYQAKEIFKQRHDWSPVDQPSNPDIPETIAEGTVEFLTQQAENYSRLDFTMMTPLLAPAKLYYDLIRDFVIPGAFAYSSSRCYWQKNIYRIGFRYWPQLDLSVGSFNEQLKSKENAFLWWLTFPCSALSLWEYNSLVGGAFRSVRDDESSSTSGKAVTEERPLVLDFNVDIVVPFGAVTEDFYTSLLLRHWQQYQRLLNVFGNVLEWRK